MPHASVTRPVLFILDGAQRVTGSLVAARRQAELLAGTVDCVIVLTDRADIDAQQLTSFRDVVRLPMRPLRRSASSVFTYPLSLLRSARRLARALDDAGCTRLQVNDYFLAEGFLVRLFGFRGRIATWVRIDPRHYGGPVAKAWLLAARGVSDRLVAVSDFVRGCLPPGYDAQVVYDPAPDLPRAAAPNGSKFVFIGNYIEGKGQDFAIAAFHRIARDHSEAELRLNGSDMGLDRNRAYLNRLRGVAAQGAGADRITLGGFVEDVGPVMDHALASLTLSRSESFSLTCQEASARGVAVIATRCGGPEEIVEHGRTGWLVPVGDVAATADAMRAALADPERTRAMGEEGAALVRQRFGSARFVEALREIFDLTPDRQRV